MVDGHVGSNSRREAWNRPLGRALRHRDDGVRAVGAEARRVQLKLRRRRQVPSTLRLDNEMQVLGLYLDRGFRAGRRPAGRRVPSRRGQRHVEHDVDRVAHLQRAHQATVGLDAPLALRHAQRAAQAAVVRQVQVKPA